MNGVVIKNQFNLPSNMGWGSPIWQNSNPHSTFSETTISISLADYNELLIGFTGGSSDDPIWLQRVIIDWDSGRTVVQLITVGDFDSTNSPAIYYREVALTKTYINFGTGYKKMTNSNSGGSTNNTSCIPYQVYAR